MPKDILAAAIENLLQGDVIAFPTETFFGLGADPRNSSAVEKILTLKQRALAEGIPLILDKAERVDELVAEEDPTVRALRKKLIDAFWPGPLTLIIATKAKISIADGVFGPERSLAVRVSPLAEARELAAAVGGAITATSANPHGKPPARSAAEAQDYFPDLCVVDQPSGGADKPSTIVDTRKIPFVIVREGAIESARLQSYLQPKTG